MVEDINPHIIGITESWANIDISDKGGVILCSKESIQAEVKLEMEANCDEAVWCSTVSYRKFDIKYWISLPMS